MATSKVRYPGIARALVKKHPACAETIAEKWGSTFENKQIGSILNDLAVVYGARNDREKAVALSSRAVALMPRRTSFIRTFAMALEASGVSETALSQYLRYLELNPNDEHYSQCRVPAIPAEAGFGRGRRSVATARELHPTHPLAERGAAKVRLAQSRLVTE